MPFLSVYPQQKLPIKRGVMTERQKLQGELDKLKLQRRELMRGRMVPSSRAQVVQRKILAVQDEIKRLDRDASERLALERAPIEDVLEIIAIPLLADVMNDIVAGVDGMLRRAGVSETIFSIYVSQIRRAALAIIDSLDQAEAGLPRLLDVDDALVDAVKKELMTFIKQRLNIQK